MKLEKYKNEKRKKVILISLSVIMLISLSLLLYKTFAFFSEKGEFSMMKGQVDYFDNSDVDFAFYNGSDKLEEMPLKDNSDKIIFSYGKCDNGASIEWDNEEWAPLVKNLSKSKTKCSLYFKEQEYINFGEIEIPVVENGDGLYKVEHNDLIELDSEWNKTEYRYAGSNPNNYVSFNNEIWRVIGLVNVKTETGVEQRLKIIRQDGIDGQKDFGNFYWDSKENGKGSSISNSGSNDWTDSQLKDMLNGIYYESKSGDCYAINNIPNTCDFTGNGVYPKGLDETARNMIDKEVIWNLGGWNTAFITAGQMYEKERESNLYTEVTRQSEWSNKTDVGEKHNGIGLMYPSDYGYVVGSNVRNTCLDKSLYGYGDSKCNVNNWLNKNTIQWLLSPDSSSDRYTYYLHSEGFIYYRSNVNCLYGVSPVVYLTVSAKIISNPNYEKEYGSIENPFILG